MPTTGRRGLTFSGIPAHTQQRAWRYSLVPEKEGGGVLTVSTESKHLRWRIPEEIDAKSPTGITRLEDSREAPKKTENSIQGVLQVHRSGSGEIYATMQDGRSNTSVKIQEKDNRWQIQPVPGKKDKATSALDFIHEVTQLKKDAEGAEYGISSGPTAIPDKVENPFLPKAPELSTEEQKFKMDPATPTINPIEASRREHTAFNTIGYPLFSPNVPGGIAAAAGIGALGGGLLNIVHRIKNRLNGEPEKNKQEPGLLSSALTGGAIGAGISAITHLGNGAQMLGSRAEGDTWGPREQQAFDSQRGFSPINTGNQDIQQGIETARRFVPGVTSSGAAADIPKVAEFKKIAFDIDYRSIAANIRSDPALAEFERNNLLNLTHQASQQKIPVDPQQLIAAGFSALASYILSRIFNAGTYGRAAVTALGGFLGGYAFAPDPRMDREGPIFTYE